jgi:prepilin-type N-terminal cleavage/methylation domain-containing protein
MLKIRFTKLRKIGIVRNQSGFTLVETLVSVALIGVIAAGLFSGLSTSSVVLLNTDVRETSKNLAETQMEYIKGLEYSTVYNPGPLPTSVIGIYSVGINVIDGSDASLGRDSYLQKIIVTITGPKNITYSLTCYKVR